MKRRTVKPSPHTEQVMQFFTPELYQRFNSSDDDVADRADRDWEAAVKSYLSHLRSLRGLPTDARKLAERNLHEAELLGLDSDHRSFFPASDSSRNAPWNCFAVAVISLRQNSMLRTLVYLLWDGVREYPPPADWPFSELRKHWLYDEFAAASSKDRTFYHRVLLSDGSILEIPFVSVITSEATMPPLKQNGKSRKTA